MSAYLRVLDHRGQRISYAAVAGDYEAAAAGRRMATWGVSSGGPNTALTSSLASIRARSRTLVRNNPWAAGGLESYVANLIGIGISPRWQLPDPTLKQELQQLWADSVPELDVDGRCDFYGLQALIARAVLESGEALVRFVPRSAGADLAVPLQLQVLEGDHLDAAYTTMADNGNQIRMGIEFDRDNRRVAYHLFKEHPGEIVLNADHTTRLRVPAADILHVYPVYRPGQLRGKPWLTPVIVRLHELDQYDDAELVRKKSAAMFGGFITEDGLGYPSTQSPLGRPGDNDANGSTVIEMEPGTFPKLPRGCKVEFSEPADVGGNYEAWIKQQLRAVARGMNITYEQLTGDLAGVNLSTIRYGLELFKRQCRMLQLQTIAFQCCRPVINRWLDTAVLAGVIDLADYTRAKRVYRRISWHPEPWPYMDPVKDRLGEQLDIRNGTNSRARLLAEKSRDVEVIEDEIAADNARADQKGLIFDSDPRQTAKSGALQQAENQAQAEEK